MPATFPPIDRDQLAGLQAGDERALERLFRERFPALLEEANVQLHEPAAARRAVETAFLQLWQQRASFETPDALESFMHRTVREAAAREQSRLASLHRFDSHEGGHARKRAPAPPPTVDEAWAHLSSVLHAPPPNHEAAARAAVEHSRHAAAAHMAAVEKREIPVGALLIGLVLLAIAGGAFWWANRRGDDARIDRALAATDARVLSAKRAQQARVTLDDGTQVVIGPESKLTVPPRFGRDVRAVKLDGTASFTVASGEQERPFRVRARNADVTATGTAFDVRAYDTDSAVVVRVREGEVAVKAGDESHTVGANKAIAIAANGSAQEPPAAALDEALAWADGRVVINNQPLRAVLPKMSRWYGLDLKVLDSTLLDRRVTMTAPLESSKQAITALENGAGVKFGYEGKDMVLRDSAAAPAAKPRPKRK
jgi:ferric-dicitrate binding protein FerR (iron transport regulator)